MDSQTLTLVTLLVVVVIVAVAIYVVGAILGWWSKRYTVDELIALLEPSIRLYKPEGPGPFPAVLQVHGCGGAKPIQDDYARAARDVGALVIVLDSLAPRGIDFDTALRLVCSGRRLRGGERAGDVVAGLEMLRRRSDVDPSRIALAGWSHGGWSIMDLLAFKTPKERPYNLKNLPPDVWKGVRGIELIYPFSGFPSLTLRRGWTKTDIPVDALLVEQDTIAKIPDTLMAFDKARKSGGQIDVETWSGVTHAFEEDEHAKDSDLRHEPKRAAEAHRRYAAWVRRVLGL
jgi:dienelactone hydrolase